MLKILVKNKNANFYNLCRRFCTQLDIQTEKSEDLTHIWLQNRSLGLDPELEQSAQDVKDLKKHAGAIGKSCGAVDAEIPEKLMTAVKYLIEKYPITQLKEQSDELSTYLWSRHFPQEPQHIAQLANQLEQKHIQKSKHVDTSEMDEDDYEIHKSKIKNTVMKKLKFNVYHWKPIEYSAFNCILYMVSRLPNDYAAVYRTLHEISLRDANFKPRTMLDFGSGVGSCIWAANSVWKNRIYEHVLVEPSSNMNTLARLLMQEGEEQKSMCFQGIHIRHSLPIAREYTYDIVICAFTLFEFESADRRLQNILELWKKTEKYLVIIELGSGNGFSLVNEARDLILQLSQFSKDPGSIPDAVKRQLGQEIDASLEGHVHAPCPHDYPCPMAAANTTAPCNFQQKYQKPKLAEDKSSTLYSNYSYVVLKKGPRDPEEHQWPRIIRDIKKPPKQVVCKTCTADGVLESNTLTKRVHGPLFRCAKACRWGDLLPAVYRPKTTLGRRPRATQMASREDRMHSDMMQSSQGAAMASEAILAPRTREGQSNQQVPSGQASSGQQLWSQQAPRRQSSLSKANTQWNSKTKSSRWSRRDSANTNNASSTRGADDSWGSGQRTGSATGGKWGV